MSLDSGYKAAFDLAWSPRNTFFAYVQAKGSLALVTRLWVLRLSDRHAIPVTDGHSNDWRPIWSDDERTLYFMGSKGLSYLFEAARAYVSGDRPDVADDQHNAKVPL